MYGWREYQAPGPDRENIVRWAFLPQVTKETCGTSLHLEGRQPEYYRSLRRAIHSFLFEKIILRLCFDDHMDTLGILQVIQSNKRLHKIHLDLRGNRYNETCIDILVDLVARGIVNSLVLFSITEEENVEKLLMGIMRSEKTVKTLDLAGSVLNDHSLQHLQAILSRGNVSKYLNLSHCKGIYDSSLTSKDRDELIEAEKRSRSYISWKSNLQIDWFTWVGHIDVDRTYSRRIEYVPIPGVQYFDEKQQGIVDIARFLIRQNINQPFQRFKRKAFSGGHFEENLAVEAKKTKQNDAIDKLIKGFESAFFGVKKWKHDKQAKEKKKKDDKKKHRQKQTYQEPSVNVRETPMHGAYKGANTASCRSSVPSNTSFEISPKMQFTNYGGSPTSTGSIITPSFFHFGTPDASNSPRGNLLSNMHTSYDASYVNMDHGRQEDLDPRLNPDLQQPGRSGGFYESFVNIEGRRVARTPSSTSIHPAQSNATPSLENMHTSYDASYVNMDHGRQEDLDPRLNPDLQQPGRSGGFYESFVNIEGRRVARTPSSTSIHPAQSNATPSLGQTQMETKPSFQHGHQSQYQPFDASGNTYFSPALNIDPAPIHLDTTHQRNDETKPYVHGRSLLQTPGPEHANIPQQRQQIRHNPTGKQLYTPACTSHHQTPQSPPSYSPLVPSYPTASNHPLKNDPRNISHQASGVYNPTTQDRVPVQTSQLHSAITAEREQQMRRNPTSQTHTITSSSLQQTSYPPVESAYQTAMERSLQNMTGDDRNFEGAVGGQQTTINININSGTMNHGGYGQKSIGNGGTAAGTRRLAYDPGRFQAHGRSYGPTQRQNRPPEGDMKNTVYESSV
ncbi:uncharacterized protein LOC144432085 [Styela clava]